jgi:predicted house-cleaning NTP pyrophosphatase (Maf/HAM1 superfamily)
MDELAAQYGFAYEVAKADIDEKAIRHDDAHQLVLQLAHAKAAAIAAKLRGAQGSAGSSGSNGSSSISGLLVTCDQVGGKWVSAGHHPIACCCCCCRAASCAAAGCAA